MLRIHVIVENVLREGLVSAQRTTQLNTRNVVFVVVIDAVMHLLVLSQFMSEKSISISDESERNGSRHTDQRTLDHI